MNKPVHCSAEISETSSLFDRFSQKWLGNWRGLCVLLIISLVLKITLFFMTDIISNDGPVYINQAIKFLEGNWREAIKIDGAFLYSLLIAGFGYLGFDLVQAGQAISLSSSVLVLIPLYLLFREVVNERVAFLGCLAFTLSPGLNKFAVAVMRDPLFLMVFAWLVYFCWQVMKEAKIRYFVVISILSVLSPILRVEGVLVVPIIFWVLLFELFSEKRSRKPLLIGTGLLFMFLIFVALSSISTVEFSLEGQKRVQQVVHYFNKVKENRLYNYNPILAEQLRDMESSIPGGMANNDFAEISRNHIGLIYLLGLISLLAQVIWFPFFVVFLFGLPQLRALGRGPFLLFLFMLPYLFMASLHNVNLGFLEERYLYVPVTLMFFGVGLGLERILKLLSRLPFSKLTLVFFGIIFFGIPLVQTIREETKPEAISSRQAGEWLAEKPELMELSLISNGKKIPFYAGRGRDFIDAEFTVLHSLKETVVNNHIQLVAIEVRKSNLNNVPDFSGYSLLAKFEDPRYIAMIYHRNP